MAGQRRLESFSALVATAVEDGRAAGHVIETGVWRGGASFIDGSEKTLEASSSCVSALLVAASTWQTASMVYRSGAVIRGATPERGGLCTPHAYVFPYEGA
jgi:hypothetical protein